VQQDLLKQFRLKQARDAQPSLGIIDSQTVRTSKLADADTVGINGHRWIKGRKRHLLVEVNGHLLSVQLQPANLPDEIGAWQVIRPVKGLTKILADQGYDNDLLKDLCQAVHQTELEIVRKQPDQKGFVVQPKRWVVERSHAWHGEKRRLKVDYERKIQTAEAFLWLSDSVLLLNKIHPN
jgi:putative transposase